MNQTNTYSTSEVLPQKCTARVESRDSGGGAYIVGARQDWKNCKRADLGIGNLNISGDLRMDEIARRTHVL